MTLKASAYKGKWEVKEKLTFLYASNAVPERFLLQGQ